MHNPCSREIYLIYPSQSLLWTIFWGGKTMFYCITFWVKTKEVGVDITTNTWISVHEEIERKNQTLTVLYKHNSFHQHCCPRRGCKQQNYILHFWLTVHKPIYPNPGENLTQPSLLVLGLRAGPEGWAWSCFRMLFPRNRSVTVPGCTPITPLPSQTSPTAWETGAAGDTLCAAVVTGHPDFLCCFNSRSSLPPVPHKSVNDVATFACCCFDKQHTLTRAPPPDDRFTNVV